MKSRIGRWWKPVGCVEQAQLPGRVCKQESCGSVATGAVADGLDGTLQFQNALSGMAVVKAVQCASVTAALQGKPQFQRQLPQFGFCQAAGMLQCSNLSCAEIKQTQQQWGEKITSDVGAVESETITDTGVCAGKHGNSSGVAVMHGVQDQRMQMRNQQCIDLYGAECGCWRLVIHNGPQAEGMRSA